MRRKIIGIFVCILMISCSTMTLALTPFSRDGKQTKNQFCDSTPVPLPPSKGWMKTFGGIDDDEGRSVLQTTDGRYIITGYTEPSGFGNEDVWLIKTDDQGKSKTTSSDNLWFEWLFQRCPNLFPLLRQLMGY